MASFQAKIGRKRQKKRENKNYRRLVPYPTRNRKLQKNSKKIQKIKKHHYGFISSQTRMERLRNRENKNYRFDHFLPGP